MISLRRAGALLSASILLITFSHAWADNPMRQPGGHLDLPAPASDGDAIELNSGQRFVGQWLEQTITLRGRMGDITLPTRQVYGMKMDGPGAATQYLVTRGGDTLVGLLVEKSLHLKTPDGRTIELATAEIHRMATQRLAPTTLPTTRGDVVVATYPSLTTDRGDEVAIQSPDSIPFWTRYGRLQLNPAQIATIEFRIDGHPGHRVLFTDGSVLFGLVDGDALTFTPRALSLDSVSVPVAAIAKISFDSPPTTPNGGLRLVTGDILIGHIAGDVTIQTDQGDIKVAGTDIKTLASVEDSPGELHLTQANGPSVTGPPAEVDAQFQMDCGLKLKVPLGLVTNYTSK